MQVARPAFDGNGDLTLQDSVRSTCDAANQTASIQPSSTESMTYTGATQGDRVATAISPGATGTYQYGLLGLSSSTISGAATSFTRDAAGKLTEERTAGGNYYYLFDALGSVVGLTDSSGSLVNTYQYDPYGKLVNSTGTVTNPWQFAGAYFDSYTGLYKMGQRYYDPALGRFTQQDPQVQWLTPQGWNRYAYSQDDPIDMSDPTGADCGTDIGIAEALLAGAGLAVIGTVGQAAAEGFKDPNADAVAAGAILTFGGAGWFLISTAAGPSCHSGS